MLIGLSGAAGSGKDTAAKAIIDELGYVKASFAGVLKQVLCHIFDWPLDAWENNAWKEAGNPSSYDLSPRFLALTLGTTWGRNSVNPNIWVDALMKRLQKDADVLSTKHIFTDVRFPNEAYAIRKNGGVLLFITCRDRQTTTDYPTHESEQWLPWLHLFADAEVSADFGDIVALQEAAVHSAANYLTGGMPKFKMNPETHLRLEGIREQIVRETAPHFPPMLIDSRPR